MNKVIKNSSSSINICTVLFLIFLVLKLIGNITWSWWWVTAPLWIPWGIIIAMIVIPFLIAGIVLLVAKLCGKTI